MYETAALCCVCTVKQSLHQSNDTRNQIQILTAASKRTEFYGNNGGSNTPTGITGDTRDFPMQKVQFVVWSAPIVQI